MSAIDSVGVLVTSDFGSRAYFARMNALIVKHRLHPAIDRVLPAHAM
jgi:hypothetical protein